MNNMRYKYKQNTSEVAFSKNISEVKELFTDVSSGYDVMNDLMSLTLHRLWKKRLISMVGNFDSKILDMACGTGDISIYLNRMCKKFNLFPEIFSCDVNQSMLSIARDKAFDLNVDNIHFSVEDAQDLSFEDNFFDYYIISFGIRNIESIQNALTESLRVLKTTGQFLCLEFFKPKKSIFRNIYRHYLFSLLPRLGRLVLDNDHAYEYLARTIDNFSLREEFYTMLYDVGFVNVGYIDLFPGVASIFYGYKS